MDIRDGYRFVFGNGKKGLAVVSKPSLVILEEENLSTGGIKTEIRRRLKSAPFGFRQNFGRKTFLDDDFRCQTQVLGLVFTKKVIGFGYLEQDTRLLDNGIDVPASQKYCPTGSVGGFGDKVFSNEGIQETSQLVEGSGGLNR